MATAAEERKEVVALAKSRVKRNRYTQGEKRVYVGGYPSPGDGVMGYSDCSAFVRWAIQKALGVDIGYNTSAQIKNRGRGVLVEMAGDAQVQPTQALLLPGDCLYFKGTPSHMWQAGHVEMYLGNGKCIGHGSGIGPTVKALKAYCQGRSTAARKYLCAIRWIPDDSETELGGRLLKLGDEGADVVALQKLLKVLGYDLGATGADRDGCDGEYGSLTRQAVRSFEQAHALQADGIADVACIEAIQTAAGQALGQVRVTGKNVNVRSGPGTDRKILGYVRKGDVLDRNGGDTEAWRGVKYKGQAAYASSKYLEEI
jgi:hypothetical protein